MRRSKMLPKQKEVRSVPPKVLPIKKEERSMPPRPDGNKQELSPLQALQNLELGSSNYYDPKSDLSLRDQQFIMIRSIKVLRSLIEKDIKPA